MFLLKLGSELQNSIKKFQSVLYAQTKCRPNFHEVEYAQGGVYSNLLLLTYYRSSCSQMFFNIGVL